MSTKYVYWISIDPVRKNIDPYPGPIAKRLEKLYNERDIFDNTSCVLGSDFFNATVHFHCSGSLYQTTPGCSMGRAEFKQPGYRSVSRLVVERDEIDIKVYVKKIHGEWRLAFDKFDACVELNPTIQKEHLIELEHCEDYEESKIDFWKPEDLDSNDLNKYVIIWEWCRGTYETNNNLMMLSNEWWNPYLFYQNEKIEKGFINKEHSTSIVLPNETNERIIEFIPNTNFANQIRYDSNNKKYIRLIRRKIITIKDLKEKIENNNNLPTDPSILESILNSDEIPNEFYCSISQSVMIDPVKTIDGHTYDRLSIKKWLNINKTSPLTGLQLSSSLLVPNVILKDQIEKFTKEKISNQ
tara:strand:+ start:24 stop:1088 length:1065 start_codon:yes stop_codon:yes gene_type:complete